MSNSTTRYLSLLHEYGITLNEEDLGDIKANSIEELTEILSILKSLVLSEDLFLSIINITNLETVKEIREYVVKGYISKTLLSNNIELFNNDNSLLNIIKTNINLFNSYGLNPTMFSDNEDILFIDSTLLDKNLRLLENYGLTEKFQLLTNNYPYDIEKFNNNFDGVYYNASHMAKIFIQNKSEKAIDGLALITPSMSAFLFTYKSSKYLLFCALSSFFITLNINNPTIVGHSFGGRVAIKYNYYYNLNKLILLDSAGIRHRSLRLYKKIIKGINLNKMKRDYKHIFYTKIKK